MGTWGTGLYSSDVACDVRDDYREMLVYHYTHEDAVKEIIKIHALKEDDPYDAAGWFALADCAWKYGHLDDELKTFVMRLIDENVEDELWDTPSDKRKRKAQLSKLYEKLQHPPEKISKPTAFLPHKCNLWQEGDLLALKMLNGEFVDEYMVILIVKKAMERYSRFAQDTDLVPEYYYVITTYHDKQLPVTEDFQQQVQIYVNDDIDPIFFPKPLRATYRTLIDKYTCQSIFNGYDLGKKEQKMFSKIGNIGSDLVSKIQSEIMNSYLGNPHPKVLGETFEKLMKQNHIITYETH